MKRSSMMRRQQGMTLIELMISVAIMAVIASGAFKVYSNLQRAHQRIDEKTNQLEALVRFFQLFQQDVAYAVFREIRNTTEPFGPDDQALFESSAETVAGDDILIQWSRNSGLPNIMGQTPQSELRRVAYGLDDQKLYRFEWHQMDPVANAQPQSAMVLDNVMQLSVRFGYIKPSAQLETTTQWQKKDWQWSNKWPIDSDLMGESNNASPGNSQSSNGQSSNGQPVEATKIAMPNLIELTLEVEGIAMLTRVFEFGAPEANAWQVKQQQQPLPENPDQKSDQQGVGHAQSQ